MELDWAILETIGLGGIAIALIYFGYKIIIFLMERWRESTEALERNTQAYTQLSQVFQQSHEREMEFQKKLILLSEDTNKKVSEIHKNVIK